MPLIWLFSAWACRSSLMAFERWSRPPLTWRSSAAARDAFGELVRRFQDAAFACAFAILRERTAAEDAVQAAFLNAWLHRRELVEPAAFGGWLRTIVRTECHRILRRPQPTIVPLDDIELPAIDANEKNLLTRELRGLLLKAIVGLTDADRTVILLKKCSSDLSYEDLSLFLDVPVSTLKKRLHVARRTACLAGTTDARRAHPTCVRRVSAVAQPGGKEAHHDINGFSGKDSVWR